MLYIFTFMQKCKEIIHVHQKCGKHHILANSVMAPYVFIYANGNKAEPREATKQVVWIILRYRIFHRTIRHIRSGFPSYAWTLCALTLPAYALKRLLFIYIKNFLSFTVIYCVACVYFLNNEQTNKHTLRCTTLINDCEILEFSVR